MRINHNLASINTYRQLSTNQVNTGKSLEKLSSGLRINRAGDDAAGLAISEKMRGQIRGLDQATRNAQDGISLIQTAEGALNEVHSILQRGRELAVQASNDTSTVEDRRSIQKEINELVDEIDRIGNDTQFNNRTLLNGSQSAVGVKFHIGSNANQNVELKIGDTRSTAIGTTTGTGLTGTASVQTDFSGANDAKITFTEGANNVTVTLNQDYGTAGELVNAINQQIQGDSDMKGKVEAKLLDGNKISFVNMTSAAVTTSDGGGTVNSNLGLKITHGAIGNTLTSVNSLKVASVDTATTGGVLDQASANTAITVFDDAIKQISTERGKLGATQNRLEHTINNLTTASENLTAAESRVRDVDMAKEMMEFTKNNILNQAAQAMLAQANQQPQGVLQLLR